MTSPTAVVVVVALLVVSLAVPGVGLLRLGRPRPVGVLLLATAATLVLSAVAVVVGQRDLAVRAALAAALLLLPVALVVHPGAPLRQLVARPVDFLVLVAVVAAGLLATLLPETTVAMTLVVLMVLAAHVWWAIEHSEGRRRRALSLMALAAGAGSLAAGVLSFALPAPDGAVWAALPLAVVGPALYVGASGSSAADVRALAIAVTSHGAALLALVAVLVGIAAPLLDAGLGDAEIPVLALVAAALAPAYHPGQRALRGVVEELVLGHRDDPLAAVGLVSDRSTGDPVDSLRAVREALALPWAAVRDPDGAVVTSSGVRPEATGSVGLGVDLGDLEVGVRAGDVGLSAGDRRVLALAAPLLAQTLRAHALARDLQAARATSVLAVEEERLRLRRELHDGLGPLLSGIGFTSDAARNLVRRDPAAAEAMIDAVRAETTAALDDVRRLVYGMRPPALDELGLVGAVEQVASTLRTADGGPLRVDVEAPRELPLPAAVEVAAYRIVVEALTNVARHTRAGAVRVSLAAPDGTLSLEVQDDAGPGAVWVAGVGTGSMRERAVELGGVLEAGPTEVGGRVHARLPLLTARGATSSSDAPR